MGKVIHTWMCSQNFRHFNDRQHMKVTTVLVNAPRHTSSHTLTTASKVKANQYYTTQGIFPTTYASLANTAVCCPCYSGQIVTIFIKETLMQKWCYTSTMVKPTGLLTYCLYYSYIHIVMFTRFARTRIKPHGVKETCVAFRCYDTGNTSFPYCTRQHTSKTRNRYY